ncbi:MAG: glycoside hydrolase family 2 [Lachnospiraceae bacterium]|nr:glycoside hydrolase family 2 [Lachnospiraceae bacterium]
MRQLYTKWGKELDINNVLPAYPRPSMVRNSYLNLNGYWDYAITKSAAWPMEYDGKILVPFSPEAVLSGVSEVLQPDEYLYYAKEIQLPVGFNQGRVLLHFGAVDQMTEVYVNKQLQGSHVGGYLPFFFDVTKVLTDGINVISLRVKDVTGASYHSRGKQKLDRGGMFYTPQSGIWQTVWLESVPEEYIGSLKFTPDFDDGSIGIKVNVVGAASAVQVIISIDNETYQTSLEANKKRYIKLPVVYPWTPETPYLYDVKICYGADCVTSYFAMRKNSVAYDNKGILRFKLNNKFYFHNGLLDQGYWPDGLLTAPSDEALIFDIMEAKRLGFNTLRKHIKIEPERWYYHCDRLGMLVWQDMVNGGGPIRAWFTTYMPHIFLWAGRSIKDNKYKLFSRDDAAGRKQFYQELKQTIETLYHHPSIVLWSPFNEGWGQFDAQKATALIKKLDTSRLIDEVSGWFDQGGGNVYSIHNYFLEKRVKPKKERVVAITEYGGYVHRYEKHSYHNNVYGYGTYKSKETLTAGYAKLFKRDVLKNIKRGLSGAIYTQLSDVEEEVNGIFTYDRKILKMYAEAVIELNEELRRKAHEIINGNSSML